MMTEHMNVIEKYKGHVEYEHGHVHYLPITAGWTVVCYDCRRNPLGHAFKSTRRAAIEWLENHRNEHD